MKYAMDVDPYEFVEETEVFRVQARELSGNLQKLSPLNLLNLIAKNDQKDTFPNVAIALRMYCTLPTTSASCERSFSKLKLIKNYLRSTMSRERLTNPAILSIESVVAYTVNFDSLIDIFSEKNPGKNWR